VQVRRANGPVAGHGTEGTLVGEGRTGEVFSLDGDGLAWAGLARCRFPTPSSTAAGSPSGGGSACTATAPSGRSAASASRCCDPCSLTRRTPRWTP
jgi:hypothetical protein